MHAEDPEPVRCGARERLDAEAAAQRGVQQRFLVQRPQLKRRNKRVKP